MWCGSTIWHGQRKTCWQPGGNRFEQRPRLVTVAKSKKIFDEIADDNERTNSMGLFNTAEAYCRAAQDLATQKRKGPHAEKPVEHLFIHSIELYLKAPLGQLYGVAELEKKFRHNIPKLLTEAEQDSLVVSQEYRGVLALLTEKIALRRRYLSTGSLIGRQPNIVELDRVCRNLRNGVRTRQV